MKVPRINKCLSCNKAYSNKTDEELKNKKKKKKRFKNTFNFANSDINKFVLLLRKGVRPYQCMDEWESLTKHHCQKTMIFIFT